MRRGSKQVVPSWLWIVFTLTATATQTARNAMQRELVATLGTVGATHVRFLFGLPFAVLFLVVMLMATRWPLPALSGAMIGTVALGAGAQIGATATMLAAMRARSFVVTIAYTKTEPVQVALFGAVLLGEHPSGLMIVAILVTTAGVLVTSWPKSEARGLGPPALGLLSGALFALSTVAYHAAIISIDTSHFPLAATIVLVLGLLVQTLSLSTWLAVMDMPVLLAILARWRPSITAGLLGATASQFWFLAFAITSAAQVRTLGVVEMIFAQIVSRRVLREGVSRREIAGMALIVGGIVLLLNA